MPLGLAQPHCGDRTPGVLILKPVTESMKKGYNLHISRLGYIADTVVMRTFKFPLVKVLPSKKKKDFSNVPQELVEAIIHDDLYLRGISNPVDYVNYVVRQRRDIYSLIDLWVDSLKAGAIFFKDAKSLRIFVAELYGNDNFTKLLPGLADYFEINEFLQKIVFRSPDLRGGDKREKLIKLLAELSKVPVDQNPYINELVSVLLTEEEQIVPREKQISYWKERWNLDVESITNKLSYDFTVFFHPDLVVDDFGKKRDILEIFEEIIKKRLLFILKHYMLWGIPGGEVLEKTPPYLRRESEDSLSGLFKFLWSYFYEQLKDHNPGKKEEKLKNETERFLDGIIKILSSSLGLIEKSPAFSNYFNFISRKGFWGVFRGGGEKAILEYYSFLGVPPELSSFIEMRLIWLAGRVEKFIEHAGSPKTYGVKDWHDYRSIFGGKLHSWFTLFIKRYLEQKEQIEKLLTSFKDIQKFINFKNHTPPEDIDEQAVERRKEDILNTIERIKQLTETEDVYNDKKAYSALVELVNDLRYQLNLFYQAYYEEEAKESPGDHPLLKDFWSLKIYKPRSFYGYAQREKVAKLVKNTIPTIKSGITIVNDLIPKLLETVDWQKVTEEKDRKTIREDAGIRRLLQFILNKYKDKAVNTNEFREFYKSILLQYIADTVSIRGPDGSVETKPINKADVFEKYKYLIYKSAHSTSPLKEVDLAVTDYVDAAKGIMMRLINQLNKYDTQTLLNNPKLLLDWVETAKVVVARLIGWNGKEGFDLEEYGLALQNLKFFERAHLYLEKLNISEMPHNEFAKFVNSYIMSDFKGSATVFSKRRIRVRYIVQPVGSEGKYPLFVEKKNGEIVDINELQTNRKEVLKEILFKVGIPIKDASRRITMFKKKEWKNTLKRVDELVINTSYYQLQWLERLIYKPQNWQDFEITTTEPSLIVEQRYSISWNLSEELPEFKLEKDKKPVLYYTLPFKVDPKKEKEQRAKIFRASLKTEPQNYYFLGADIGEYGIAWIIIKVNEEKRQIIVKDYGFIYDPRIKRIQEHFKEVQQKARLGEFLEESTVVAYLRENAIGYLRNRLHDKLTKYKGHIIYEANISAFEAGSGRVTKIYDSVKRPDVGNHPDATRDVYSQLIKHIWGLKTGGKKNAPGWQVGAAGTSYTCTSCGRNVYDIRNSDSIWKIEQREENIVTFTNGKVKVLGYTEARLDPNKEYKSKDIFKYIKAFTRPPLAVWVEREGNNSKNKNQNSQQKKKGEWVIKSETVKKFVIDRGVLSKEQVIKMRQHRGNSALFVCPYADCVAVADADIQAAFNIALRGYIYATEFAKGNDPKSENTKFKEAFTRKLAELSNFKKVGKVNWLFTK